MADSNNISRGIPTLTGTDNFVKWKRCLDAYLLKKQCHRVVQGRELEPYRRIVQGTSFDLDVIHPAGQHAVDDYPEGEASTESGPLNASQRDKWQKWSEKEVKARATIIMSVSDGIAAELDLMWSSTDMYTHLCATHRIDTFQRRGYIATRLSLPEFTRTPLGSISMSTWLHVHLSSQNLSPQETKSLKSRSVRSFSYRWTILSMLSSSNSSCYQTCLKTGRLSFGFSRL